MYYDAREAARLHWGTVGRRKNLPNKIYFQSKADHPQTWYTDTFFLIAPMTLTLSRWSRYTSLTCRFWRCTVGYLHQKMNFLSQGFPKLEHNRHMTHRHTKWQTRPNAFRPSVRPSVTRVNCDKTVESSVQIFIPYESSFRRRMVGGGRPLLPEILGQPTSVGAKSPIFNRYDFQPILAHISSAVTPSEKSSINTNRKSTTRFPMSLRWSSYVALSPPKVAQKRKTAVFGIKSHFAWRKSATKFLRVKTVSVNL